MLLFKKKLTLFLICSLFFISACGFQPIYATRPNGPDISQQLAQIQITNIPDRSGQKIRNLLIDRMYTQYRPKNPLYTLSIFSIKEIRRSLGIKKDASATRSQIVITLNLNLIETATGKSVMKRALKSTNSYNILDSQFTTMVTEKDARERALSQLSDDIMTQLSLYFNR